LTAPFLLHRFNKYRGAAVGRYQSDEKRLATWHELVSFLPRDLRLATDAEVGRFIREADLEVLIP
jgi:hypothetical protein